MRDTRIILFNIHVHAAANVMRSIHWEPQRCSHRAYPSDWKRHRCTLMMIIYYYVLSSQRIASPSIKAHIVSNLSSGREISVRMRRVNYMIYALPIPPNENLTIKSRSVCKRILGAFRVFWHFGRVQADTQLSHWLPFSRSLCVLFALCVRVDRLCLLPRDRTLCNKRV